MNKEDEEEVRIAVENNEYVAISYVKELLEEIDLLRYQILHQTKSFNDRIKDVEERARAEGRSDVAVKLRQIVDPKDINYYNLDGSLNHIQKMKDILTLILELDALKSFAFDPGDGDLSLVDKIKILSK